jgi:hypothetical protein
MVRNVFLPVPPIPGSRFCRCAAGAALILPWVIRGRFALLWIFWIGLVNLAAYLYYDSFHGYWGLLLGTRERRRRKRLRDRGVKFGTSAFFFEEGTAAVYSQAVYGEFRVDTDGEAILTQLRGEGLQRLQPGPDG